MLYYHNRYIIKVHLFVTSEGFMQFTYFGELFNLSPVTLIIILAILLLLFGGKKLPELARSLGDSAKELRKGLSDDDDKKAKADNKAE